VESIFNKIDECDVFIGDISIINLHEDNTARRVPNPNVLIELGYAAAKLGWENIILIYNLDFGRIDDMPFDLRQRRPIFYDLSEENNSEKPEKKKILRSQLKNSLIEIINSKVQNTEGYVKILYPHLYSSVYLLYNSIEEMLDTMLINVSGLQSSDIYNHEIDFVVDLLKNIEDEFEKHQLRAVESKKEFLELIKLQKNYPNLQKNDSEEEDDDYLYSDFWNDRYESIFKDSEELILLKINELLAYKSFFPDHIVKNLYYIFSVVKGEKKLVEFWKYAFPYESEYGEQLYLSKLKFNYEVFIDILLELNNLRNDFLNAFDTDREVFLKNKRERYSHLRNLINQKK